jgi:predicted membrane chloride channel (bestrophin family)
LYTEKSSPRCVLRFECLRSVTLEENDRKCRAWCSQFSLGPQPHTYIGVILFLLMAFRSNQSYHSYEVGLTAWTTIRREILAFTSTMLSATPRDSIKREERLRMLSFVAAFPYFLFADLNEERIFRT